MTDNVTFGANTFATDDVGGVQYQIVKLAQGVADSATLVSSTDPLNVTTPDDTFTVTPTLDTGNAYASGDVLFATTLIDANTSRASGKVVTLNSIVLVDKVDRGPTYPEIVLIFFDSNTSVGAMNAAFSLSDANALTIVSLLKLYVSDFGPFTTFAMAEPDFRPRQMKPSGTAIYVAGIILAAGTYTNGDLQFKFGFNR